jgi:hypothetical protein
MIFYFGDAINSFRILTGLAMLGAFLYRPKNTEYQHIIESLIEENEDE